MRILIANDDGIEAAGLRALVRVFSEAGHEITVVAPDGERSAASHSVTLRRPVPVRRSEVARARRAFAVSGTPADCVKLALRCLAPDTEFVLSGVNHGYNMGTDVLYSGTVGAAMEGALGGVPSMAVSLGRESADFEGAARVALRVFRMLASSPLPPLHIANLNVPETGEVLGLRAVPLCRIWYDDRYDRASDADGTEYYTLGGWLSESIPDGKDDYHLLLRGYATLSILSYDLEDHGETERWEASCRSLHFA
ncbi:MAG: 5'/3'-nucleotidase SurE [Clostridiales bacterium]|nr:5'/3'-nucleotidase SurE [Clostridiales bacterium]